MSGGHRHTLSPRLFHLADVTIDMITAHASYWTDPSFAAFLLAETFSTRLDLVRTGLGLAEQILPEGTTL